MHDLNNWRARGCLKMRGKGKTWKWDWAFPLNDTINLSGIRSVIEFSDFIFQLEILSPYRHISASAKKSISLWFSGVTKWMWNSSGVDILVWLWREYSIYFLGSLCKEKNLSRYHIKMYQRYLLQTKLIMIKIHIKHTPLGSCQNWLMQRKEKRGERTEGERERERERERGWKKRKNLYKY